MNKVLQILHIEDNSYDVELTQHALKKAGVKCKVKVVQSEQEFVDALNSYVPDLILSDHSLPGFDSVEAFRIMNELKPGIPFILLTGSVSEQFAVDSLLAGVDDYILKSNIIRLPSSIERILSKKQISTEKEIIQQLHTQLKSAFEEIELKNKEITDSITYAKRIQEAILPHHDEFHNELSQCFLIYKPRDIVSGDLYWIARVNVPEVSEFPLIAVAAVDCTGHGVPGAFMSLLVSDILNQVLKNPDIKTPGEALSFMNHRLPAKLNKNNKERIGDGLDIALCVLDPLTKMLHYAGANRPLWIARKNRDNYELLEWKATKASIGLYTPSDQKFDTHTIQLQQGDRLFIFTDGITDQFGGKRGKKLGSKGFRELLLKSAHLSINEQKKEIEEFIKTWQDDKEQVDDILLIGVEID